MFYKVAIRFAEVETDSPKHYEAVTRFAEVKIASPNLLHALRM